MFMRDLFIPTLGILVAYALAVGSDNVRQIAVELSDKAGEGQRPSSAAISINSRAVQEGVSYPDTVQSTHVVSSAPVIAWHVISSCGIVEGNWAGGKIDGTAGQTAIGRGSVDNIELHHGFWQSFMPFLCDCRPGDANGDGGKNVADAVYLVSYVFKGGAAPTPYAKCSGDANGDCAVNVGDAVYMIAYVFKGGLPPVSCDEWVTACGKPLR